MQTTLTHEYADLNLDILVDYNKDGISVEDILHCGESIVAVLDKNDYSYLEQWAIEQHDKLLESDEYARADEKNDYRKD